MCALPLGLEILLPYIKTIITTDVVERRTHTTVSLDFLKM